MLETSNALKTCQSKNFQDILSSNQQGTEISPKVLRFLNLNTSIICEVIFWDLLGLLRDYT